MWESDDQKISGVTSCTHVFAFVPVFWLYVGLVLIFAETLPPHKWMAMF